MQSILVIDDDETLRDTLAVMLEQEGFTIAQAADLLLVDLRLPRSSNIQTPIIVLSAVGGEVDQSAAAGDWR